MSGAFSYPPDKKLETAPCEQAQRDKKKEKKECSH